MKEAVDEQRHRCVPVLADHSLFKRDAEILIAWCNGQLALVDENRNDRSVLGVRFFYLT